MNGKLDEQISSPGFDDVLAMALVRFAIVVIVGALATAIGDPFVGDAYRRAFFVVCGAMMGAAAVMWAARSTSNSN